ncbi:actin-binding Rho-activating protein-like [Carcharodon carcharias]|uniref:actin-binding Rho-activating protein-like n=1 Tax=Carcharodon carcharias TaxID=13397 RepID=UPI001B7E1268|nr:actin-binding Rho-activating protein-like [Carcharodon carcharias]
MAESGGNHKVPGTPGQDGTTRLRQKWQEWADDHRDYQRCNPFSGSHAVTLRLQREGQEYGHPKKGSKTEQRGKDAHTLVGKEVEELLYIIRRYGEAGPDGNICVTFGRLFDAYVTISNKLVGILLRARKYGLVHFDGEMLWQGRDDRTLIILLE